MILDALQKVNSSLNNTSKSLMNEDLKSILNIHHFGLDEALQIANNGNKFSNPITYLKFKVIDALKDLELSKKILGSYFKTQLTKIEEAIENPLIRKDLLKQELFQVKNKENYVKVENFNDVLSLHAEGMKEATDKVMTSTNVLNAPLGVKTHIMNPFNNVVMDLEMQTERQHSLHNNRVFTLDTEYHDIHSLFVVQLKTNSDNKLNLTNDESKNKLLFFEFIVYHELAHTSYNQISKVKKEDSGIREMHSDLSSIIKMIKNHDLNEANAFKLCKEIFSFRLNSPSQSQYFSKDASIREHFTELSIVKFASILDSNMEKLKSLKDNEIGDFVETFLQEAKKQDLNILPKFEDKSIFVKSLVKNYIEENIGEESNRLMDSHIYSTLARTKFYQKSEFKLKELYNEMTREETYRRIQNTMCDNLMRNDDILTDVYLQNRKLTIGDDKLFVESYVKYLPEGKELSANVTQKYDLYNEMHNKIKTSSVISQSNSIKIKNH